MCRQIKTDVITLDKNTENIEEELHKKFYAEVVRWAIVSVEGERIKVCCSYKC